MSAASHNLYDLLCDTVENNSSQALLFSGGLDSSILASIDPGMTAIHITLGYDAPDLQYARAMTEHFGLELVHLAVTVEEAVAAIPEVMGHLQCFDPAIPNDLAAWFGLKKAKELGFTSIMTGDGADELFAGYDFMRDIADLDAYLQHMSRIMSFSSNILGDALDIDIVQPFLHKDVHDMALSIPVKFKINEHNGTVFGKWILRKAFEEHMPSELVWQSKRPLEVGSGMTGLRQILADRIDPLEMEREGDGIQFYSAEHFYYYRIYKSQFGAVVKAADHVAACPGCGGAIASGARHCRVCGWAGALTE